jgi:hypothetical protein
MKTAVTAFVLASSLVGTALAGAGDSCPEAVTLIVDGPVLGYDLDCFPTACMSAGTSPKPCPCDTALDGTGAALTSAPPGWITGKASDSYGRGGWFKFTTPPATAFTISINTNTAFTAFDNYLNLFAACPADQAAAALGAIAWDDDCGPSSQIVAGVNGGVAIDVDSANDTVCGRGGLCSCIQTADLLPATTYYVLANAYSDPGSPSLSSNPTPDPASKFAIGITSDPAPVGTAGLCGSNCGGIPEPIVANIRTCSLVVADAGATCLGFGLPVPEESSSSAGSGSGGDADSSSVLSLF